MEWGQVQSVEQLKGLGHLKDVAKCIADDLGAEKVPRNSWDKLWGFIEKYRKREEIKSEDGTKADWQLVASSKELSRLGISFREMKEVVSQAIAPVVIRAKSWEELYEVICERFPQNVTSKNTVSKEEYNSLYFKDEVSEIIFYLLELEGEARLKKLKINNRFYKDKKQANEWKNELMKKIHPDQSHHEKAEEATKELNKLYGSMIKFAK